MSNPTKETTMQNEQAVRLVDTISIGWYIAAVLLPIVGFFAAIVFMAKSKIGPSLALFMTSGLASITWALVYAWSQYGS
jgi:hypothetical protein